MRWKNSLRGGSGVSSETNVLKENAKKKLKIIAPIRKTREIN